jgi:hypothetical protein
MVSLLNIVISVSFFDRRKYLVKINKHQLSKEYLAPNNELNYFVITYMDFT